MRRLWRWLRDLLHRVVKRRPPVTPARPARIAADDQYWTPELGFTINGKPPRTLTGKQKKIMAREREKAQARFMRQMEARHRNPPKQPPHHAPNLREPLWGRIIHTPWRWRAKVRGALTKVGWLLWLRKLRG